MHGKSFFDQLNVALSKYSLWERCLELRRVLALPATSKELSMAFVQLCGDIFGLAAGGNLGGGWNLTSLTRYTYVSAKEFAAVLDFLSAGGPLMELILKLLHDPANIFDFPLTQIPIAQARSSFAPLQGCLTLCSFEFYFYHFFNLPHRSANATVNTSGSASLDTVYAFLVEDYLNHFLPIDPHMQAQLFTQDVVAFGPQFPPQISPSSAQAVQNSNASVSSHGSSGSFKGILKTSKSSQKSLFRKEFYSSLSHADPMSGLGGSAGHLLTSQNVVSLGADNAKETWRLDTIVRIVAIFWLEPYAAEDVVEMSKCMVPDGNQSSVYALQCGTSYLGRMGAGSELVKLVRMFIKHAHYFRNTCLSGKSGLYLPSSLKYEIFADHINPDVMYFFLSNCILHWPRDGSFRLILETWLSYIQPWRYMHTAKQDDDNASGLMEQPDQWILFMKNNSKCYHQLLSLVLHRFLGQELNCQKTAYMLFRVCKVLSQEHLLPTLQSATSLVHGINVAEAAKNKDLSHLGAPQEWLEPINNIFGPDFQNLVWHLLSSILEAKYSEVQANQLLSQSVQRDSLLATRNNSASGLSSWMGWLMSIWRCQDQAAANAAKESHDREKVIYHLDFCMNKLSEQFHLRNVFEEYQDQFLDMKSRTLNTTDTLSELQMHGLTETLSPTQQRQLLQKRLKILPKYKGNPDELPVRSDEFAWMVRLCHRLSQLINNRLSTWLEQSYSQPNLAGSLTRMVCEPACTYIATSHIQGYRRQRMLRLPPRIVLRPLASQVFVVYFTLFWLLVSFFTDTSLLTALILIVSLLAFLGLTWAWLQLHLHPTILRPLHLDS